jgi:transposase
VVDHERGRLLWASVGWDAATVDEFFDALGPERCAAITYVSADVAPWIAKSVAAHCPAAVRCADPFHILAWATDALDQVRRDAWNAAVGREHDTARTGRRATAAARALKNTRDALWKNPEDLTVRQHDKLAWIAKADRDCGRPTCSKNDYATSSRSRARRAGPVAVLGSPLPHPVVRRAGPQDQASLRRDDNALDHGLSNALIESMNTKIRQIARTAYGFADPDTLFALALLAHGGYRPELPGRTTHT